MVTTVLDMSSDPTGNNYTTLLYRGIGIEPQSMGNNLNYTRSISKLPTWIVLRRFSSLSHIAASGATAFQLADQTTPSYNGDGTELVDLGETALAPHTTPVNSKQLFSQGSAATTVLPEIPSPSPKTPVPSSRSKTTNLCRSPISEVKIRSDDDEIIRYQELRITGIVYCDSNSYGDADALSVTCDDDTFQKQQAAIMHDHPYGFLRCAGVVYACSKGDDDDALSISSNDATSDPSDLDYFFEDKEEAAIFQSPKGVMEFG
eukprot:CAMPEP_0119022450 /NCGR_PEP_ID=MMETSP1176-20130426/28058_1 /TAXON_ID=265551 /ORGANISM="Synedropsis recta cf, Strain CCMP1620" /LENGTH=260 /DNA_ID=CAMNT_0006977315 /DNA_START=65 /DNA_END=843 /DNA_ORIENTATION=-